MNILQPSRVIQLAKQVGIDAPPFLEHMRVSMTQLSKFYRAAYEDGVHSARNSGCPLCGQKTGHEIGCPNDF